MTHSPSPSNARSRVRVSITTPPLSPVLSAKRRPRHLRSPLYFLLSTLFLTLALPLHAAQTYNSFPVQSGSVFRPVIDGDWIAWAETGSYALYAHNIKTNQTLRLSERDPASSNIYPSVLVTTASPWHPSIDIADGRVIYTERINSPYKGTAVRVYDLNTNTRATLATSWDLLDFPAISSNFATWAYGSTGFTAYNLKTNSRSSPVWDNYCLPTLSGNYATWSYPNDVAGDIYVRDLTTGQTKILFDANENQNPRPPVIDGNIVAWSMRETTSGLGDVVKIMAADISTGQVYTLCENTHSPEHRSIVAVSGQTIVWEDWRQNTNSTYRYNLDLYGYNLLSQREFIVANNTGNQYEPDMDGNIVAFHQNSRAVNWIAITIAGDFTGDGRINADDVDPFALAISDLPAFTAAHPNLDPLLLDLTGDGVIDVQDINPFLKLAGLPDAPTPLLALIPEPATLFLLPALALVTRHRRP